MPVNRSQEAPGSYGGAVPGTRRVVVAAALLLAA